MLSQMLHPQAIFADSLSKGRNLKNVTDFGHSARLGFFLASSIANVFLVELFSLGPTGCKHNIRWQRVSQIEVGRFSRVKFFGTIEQNLPH